MGHGWKRIVGGPIFPMVVAMLITTIVSVQGYILYTSYQATWLLATRSEENVLRTIAANIKRNLDIIELSLIGLEAASQLDGLDELNPQMRNMLLFDRAASARYLGALLVLNPEGSIRFDSGAIPPRNGNFADRDYFQAQVEPGRGTFISKPFASRIGNGDPSIAISRRISQPDGSFAGAAIGSIRMAFFRDLVQQVNLGPDSVVGLMRTDGILLFRQPPAGHDVQSGTDIASSSVFQKLLRHPGEPVTERSVIDGVRRYYVSMRIGDFPLLLAVGISKSAAMKEWHERALATAAITLAVCILIAVLFRALRVALMRSQEMEEQLEAMAVTDALTGIPNRRAFDMAFPNELRRAARMGNDLSVLMIDVDHFKRVNDVYGHSVGDEVLSRLAGQVAASIRRPGDFAARYGGEEFVVLLPATNAAGAQMVAEKIRRAVMTMTPSPSAPELRQVTVSIGVSSLRATDAPDEPDLLRIADEALYAAKAAGRNRVMAGETPRPSAA